MQPSLRVGKVGAHPQRQKIDLRPSAERLWQVAVKPAIRKSSVAIACESRRTFGVKVTTYRSQRLSL
jgi:hypothetical protein